MNLDTRIAALTTALAEKHEAEIFKENPDGFTCAPYCNGDFLSSAFEAGASALAEVYRLEAKIETLHWAENRKYVHQESDDEFIRACFAGEAEKAEAQLKALLAKLETEAK